MSKKAIHVKVNEVTRIVTALFLLFSISYCTSKPKNTEQCFIKFERIGVLDDYEPPVIITNFKIPDSLLPHQSTPILVSFEEYHRIQRILKFKTKINPDTTNRKEFRYGSIEISENCNSKSVEFAVFNASEAREYLDFTITLLKSDNTNKEIIKKLSYY